VLVDPLAPRHELFAEISDMRDRSAETAQAELEEHT
jgi:hypothetical protein